MSQTYNIELAEHEVVVLDALLGRLADRPDLKTFVEDRAERQALHDLVALLERVDPILFADDYQDRLAQARERVCKGG